MIRFKRIFKAYDQIKTWKYRSYLYLIKIRHKNKTADKQYQREKLLGNEEWAKSDKQINKQTVSKWVSEGKTSS